jgi:hypothetical protein
MIESIESMPQTIGPNANQMWLRDYERFVKNLNTKPGGLFDFGPDIDETTVVPTGPQGRLP